MSVIRLNSHSDFEVKWEETVSLRDPVPNFESLNHIKSWNPWCKFWVLLSVRWKIIGKGLGHGEIAVKQGRWPDQISVWAGHGPAEHDLLEARGKAGKEASEQVTKLVRSVQTLDKLCK